MLLVTSYLATALAALFPFLVAPILDLALGAAIGRDSRTPMLWGLAARKVDPPLGWIAKAMGGERAHVTLFDKFPEGAVGVSFRTSMRSAMLPDDACDVLAIFRASMFVARAAEFLADVRRIVRPGGLVVIDWLHGLSNAPVLDLRGHPRYGGEPTPCTTTYLDTEFPAKLPDAFEAFLRHVNRPPTWANIERPGVPVPFGERIRRLLGQGPRRDVTRGTYLHICREELARAGKHLIEASQMEQHFKVLFRGAHLFTRTSESSISTS